jgi:serine/threonine protein kinase
VICNFATYSATVADSDRDLRSSVRRYLHEAASALAACHRKGIVHCDVKLENMLVDKGQIKVCDFGLAG